MATVSGQIVFDRNRSATIDSGDSGIANVPVVLQDIATGVRLTVLTNASGNYVFTNVPNGNYRIVEAFGTTGGVPTPGNFAAAIVGPVPIAEIPPISSVINPPIGSTNLDGTTPNTLLITVAGSDITNQNILNGPVIYTPIQNILDSCVSVSNINLIIDADNGTFGFFPPGTPSNTGPEIEPYPNVTPDFTYVVPDPTKFTPLDGEYTVQNIMTNAMSNVIGAWWRIADHTTGNETGRMMVVNGFNPGAVFFKSTVQVTPNTNFLFSTWILNLFKVTGYPPPQLGVRIFDQNNNILYQATLGAQIPVNTNAPEWKEIGTVINSQNNNQLTVEFFSEGESVIGNDYAIDDVSLREITVPTFTPIKTSNTETANIGDIVTYTVTLDNTCNSPLTNVFFRDIIPNGLKFIPGTVTVDGISVPGVDPNIGFQLPDIGGGTRIEVTFNVVVESIPNPNPTNNIATIDYSYTPVEGGIPNNFSVDSNPVPVEVISADIEVTKLSEPSIVNPGEELIYTIKVVNNGPFPSENVVLTDDVPDSIINSEYSLDGGVSFQPWNGSLNIGTLELGATRVIIIRGIVNPTTVGIIRNTAVVSSTTADPNLNNNTSTIETEVNLLADILVMKTAEPNSAVPGTLLRYTIQVANLGPANAENVILNDDIPDVILNPEYSLDGGVSFQPWNGSLNIGALNSGISLTVLIQGTVSLNSSEYIVNTATVSSTTPDPDLSNNISTIITPVNPQAGISIIKVANEDVAVPGEEFVYTIEIFNEGPSNAMNVVLTDNIPDVILNPEYSLDGGASFQPWNGSLNIGTVAPGQLIRIIIRGLVSSTATGNITNTAEVSAEVPEPVTDSSTVITPVVASADIEVIKTSNMDTAVPGEIFSYTITVTNLGPSAAQSIVLTDDIPDIILNPEYSLDGGVSFQPWNGNLNIGTLDTGEIRSIIIRGTINQTSVGTIINTATVSSTTPDPNPDNNTSTVETDISPLADISVIKGNEPLAIQGERFIYGIEIVNAGPSFSENIVLTDNIPASILNPEYSIDNGVTFQPWTGSLNIGTLDAGEIRNVIIRGTVSSTTPDPNLNNNTSTSEAEVSSSADISVVKRSNQNVVVPGDVLNYTIEVRNAGPSTAQNVTLTDNISASILSPEYSIDNGVTFQPWTGSLSIGTLYAGEIRNIIIRGIASETAIGTIINTATVSSTTPDPNPNNNTSTSEIDISSSADISIIKLANKTEACVGEQIDFVIVVSNAGPENAQNVTLIDNVSDKLKKTVFSLDRGVSFQPWTGSINIGILPAGTLRVILLRGLIKSTCLDKLTNIAEVTSTTPDSDLNNNISRVQVEIKQCCSNDCCCNCCCNNCCNCFFNDCCNDCGYKDCCCNCCKNDFWC
ncbi:cell surface protein [Clostridioides difficile]|nr:cell surface protein [Clostridioides difficile]